MPTITITYELNPPPGSSLPPSGLSSSATHDFDIRSASSADAKGYYDSLRSAIAQAKAKLGGELTEWRDAVGKTEVTKEKKKSKAAEEDDDDEEDDREEDT
jgi:hypothetical protein